MSEKKHKSFKFGLLLLDIIACLMVGTWLGAIWIDAWRWELFATGFVFFLVGVLLASSEDDHL